VSVSDRKNKGFTYSVAPAVALCIDHGKKRMLSMKRVDVYG
jgi:hypothetical protein